MTDKTDSKEREAAYDMVDRFLRNNLGSDEDYAEYSQALDTVLGASLAPSGFDAADMATASAQGFRDGVASLAASAGREPVAQLAAERDELFQAAIDFIRTLTGMEPPPIEVAPPGVFAPFREFVNTVQAITDKRHPPPPEGMVGGWIALPGTLPEPGVPVLLDIGKKYPIRAMWAAKHTVEAADDDTDWGEYDEATETYYCPEGWYEWNQCEDNHWRVTETPRAWAPLPPTSSADSRKGE